MISLMAETVRMNNNGTAVVYRPVGDTRGICCNVKCTWFKMLQKLAEKINMHLSTTKLKM